MTIYFLYLAVLLLGFTTGVILGRYSHFTRAQHFDKLERVAYGLVTTNRRGLK